MASQKEPTNKPTAPAEKSAGPVWAYVGPLYLNGIIIDEEPGIMQRPLGWDAARIEAFITRYPRYADWFVPAQPKE